MSETNDADGAAAALDLAIAVIASRSAMQHGGRKPDEGVVLVAVVGGARYADPAAQPHSGLALANSSEL